MSTLSTIQKALREHPRLRAWTLFLVKSLVVLGFFFAFAQVAPSLPDTHIAIVWAALSAIAALGIIYDIIMKKTLRRFKYQEGGRLCKINEGRKITFVLGFTLSAICIASLLFEAPKWHGAEWLVVALSIPVYSAVYLLAQRCVSREYTPLFRTANTIAWTRIITTILLVGLFIAISFAMPQETFDKLEIALEETSHPYEGSPAVLMSQVEQFTSFADGPTAYSLSEAKSTSFISYLIIRAALVASTFFGITNLLSACSLKASEAKRIFTELRTEETLDQNLALNLRSIAGASFLTLLLAFLFQFTNDSLEKTIKSDEQTCIDIFIEEKTDLAIYIVDRHYVVDGFLLESGALNHNIAEEMKGAFVD